MIEASRILDGGSVRQAVQYMCVTAGFAVGFTCALVQIGRAETQLFFDIHTMPADCASLDACVEESQPLLGAILPMSRADTQALSTAMSEAGQHAEIAEHASVALCSHRVNKVLRALPMADKSTALKNHPGVFFNSAKIDADEVAGGFSALVRTRLAEAGVTFLTEEELEDTPGRPVLKLSFSQRVDNGGCIVPFRVSMSITEEAVLVRNPGFKVTTAVWSGSQSENLASTKHSPADALDDLIAKFVEDWTAANS